MWFATSDADIARGATRAPAQVCASVYIQTLPRHLVVPTLPQHSEVTGRYYPALCLLPARLLTSAMMIPACSSRHTLEVQNPVFLCPDAWMRHEPS